MSETHIPPNSLVLYKKRPARVLKSGDRLEIELEDKNLLKVRSKDVLLLHPGPLDRLDALPAVDQELLELAQLTWEILADSGDPLTLAELAELAFGVYDPYTAWKVWQWVEDGLYFTGDLETIRARPPEFVKQERLARQARRVEKSAREDFLKRAASGCVSPEKDARYLRELEEFALGQRKESRLLRDLGRSERPENAHALLLEWGVWNHRINPYPSRLRLSLDPPAVDLPPLPEENRLDLTHLLAFAIDDRDNQDPDDAISLIEYQQDERGNFLGGQIWVHVADAAALVPPNSPADLEARARAATLYLPEGQVPMLPRQAIAALGLGLREVSPSLSFRIRLDAKAKIIGVDVHPAWVRVRRLSYEQAEKRLQDEPLQSLYHLAQAYHARRRAAGAYLLDLPETMVRVMNDQVIITPLARLRSRDLVREAMLMAGEAAAIFALQNGIPAPFVSQEASLPTDASLLQSNEASLAVRYALRRSLKRSQTSASPAPHAGVGLAAYCRVTSPLRRYLDLVVHQQLRAWLRGDDVLDQQALIERVGNTEALAGILAQAEMLARRHWTLVYLMQHPEWQGEGVIVEVNGLRGVALIPELALETVIHLRAETSLDTVLRLGVRAVNLPELEAHFYVL